MNVFITAGGTSVPIDDVRSITNMSTGRYGVELAETFFEHGHNVSLFRAKNSVFPNWAQDLDLSNRHDVTVFRNYDEYTEGPDFVSTLKPDIVFASAAVSDYIVDKTAGKISSDKDELTITLKKAKKILPEFKKASPNSMVVGFKLLVSPTFEEVLAAVRKQLLVGEVDYVVYNDLSEIRKGFETRYIFDGCMNMCQIKNYNQMVQYFVAAYPQWKADNYVEQ